MARVQVVKLGNLIQEKVLEAHQEKSGYLVLGSKAFKRRTEKEFEISPLNFKKFPLKQKKTDKYLGQVIDDNLSKSAKF